ncbi:hypothetical protein Pcinc_010424 [Petrolisthes cinctipes]|uniref:Uncharacterized protein n=1 Tax=Petrolisthes cinctipes TaxID=88211 RepID=A0AAE1G3C5_PETCI|nr:hypothetical protein Pcinc_010424 [Petrolisthes cinctipes]
MSLCISLISKNPNQQQIKSTQRLSSSHQPNNQLNMQSQSAMYPGFDLVSTNSLASPPNHYHHLVSQQTIQSSYQSTILWISSSLHHHRYYLRLY